MMASLYYFMFMSCLCVVAATGLVLRGAQEWADWVYWVACACYAVGWVQFYRARRGGKI